jgi:hypothetical protein
MVAMTKPSNKAVELPAGSVRSSLAPAFGSSSRLAFGVAMLNPVVLWASPVVCALHEGPY